MSWHLISFNNSPTEYGCKWRVIRLSSGHQAFHQITSFQPSFPPHLQKSGHVTVTRRTRKWIEQFIAHPLVSVRCNDSFYQISWCYWPWQNNWTANIVMFIIAWKLLILYDVFYWFVPRRAVIFSRGFFPPFFLIEESCQIDIQTQVYIVE